MIKLQMSRWNDDNDWRDTNFEYHDLFTAKLAFLDGDSDCSDLIAESAGKYAFRLVGDSGGVLEFFHMLPYEGYPFLHMIGENPFLELQEAYDLTDAQMIELCERYLKFAKDSE